MKPVDVKWNIYIDSSIEVHDKNPKFKIGDNVRIPKYENAFAKGYTTDRSEEFFVIKKVKNTVLWTYVISDLKEEENVGAFYEKELQKIIKKSLELKK